MEISLLREENKLLRDESALLREENALLREKNALLEAAVTQFESRIAELEKRLGQNSQNSSKPPSQDGFNKPNKSLRDKGKYKSGGQAGHPGYTLKQTAHPNKIERHRLSHCPHCSTSLEDVLAERIIKRQVFDIVLPTLEVTEHQVEVKCCHGCAKHVSSSFPSEVTAPVQYGARLQSWAVYLQQDHFIPEDRLQRLFADLLEIPIATATLTRFSEVAYTNLSDFDTTVLSRIANAPLKHLDETGFVIASKLQWLHVASSAAYTYYQAAPGRRSPFKKLKNIIVHDHFRSYYKMDDVTHALCNQHHLRELKSLVEHDNERWARNMSRCLRVMLHYRHQYPDTDIPEELLQRLMCLYHKIVQQGLHHHQRQPLLPKKGRGAAAKRAGHNLVLRLHNDCDDVLRFLTNPLVPFTNNQAEQDIRMMKCKQKISGGFRTRDGADVFARIRGFISTARKQGWNIFASLQLAIQGNPPILA